MIVLLFQCHSLLKAHYFFQSVSVVLLIISSILAAPGVTPATQNCGDVCPLDYQPICGGPSGTTNDREKKSFGNNCVMKKYNCEKGESELFSGFLYGFR